MLFYLRYLNAENVKLSSPCTANGSQGKQVSQQYIQIKSLKSEPRYL